MQRRSQNNENRYSAYLPPGSSTSSRDSSSNSTNQNTHYQYYDPRLRAQQKVQQTLNEYQYSNTSPHRTSISLYGSPRNQHHYQPPSFLQESPSSTTSISDLGEPISVFDDIKPLEYRRSIVAPPLLSTYIPPDPTRRTSVSDVRLATAHVLREQLLNDIEHTINDIDRDLTSLERQPSVSRYIPPRFSPIVEFDNQDENLFQPMRTIKPVSVPSKKAISTLVSPVHKQISQTSAHSTFKERHSSNSQIWPNKPKRFYEVIPRLTSESKRTSRQSSVGGQYEQIKIAEIQSPQSPPETLEKNISSTNLHLRGQYHYGPEAEEIEILTNDPENIDHKSVLDDIQEPSVYETLNTNQFLRDQSAAPHSRATILVPEYSGDSHLGYHESTEDLIHNDKIDTNTAQSLITSSLQELSSTKELNIQDIESLIQTAPEIRIKPEVKPRIASRSTINSHKLYHETEADLTNQNNPIISKPVEHSRLSTTTPIATDDLRENTSSSQLAPIDSTAVVPAPTDSNVSGLVAYFFSDFENEGDNDEDLIPIDQTNFSVPTGAEIIADDDISSSLMGQSRASLLILHSAHVPPHQQKSTSTMPLTIENNNERIKAEEKEVKGEEIYVTKKRISTTTSILPFSSPSPKQVLPISIIDDMQTQFTRNNNANNDDYQRRPSTTTLNTHAVDSNLEEQERRSNNSQLRLHSSSLSSQMHSRIHSSISEQNNEEIKKNHQATRYTSLSNTPLQNIDNENTQTPERIDSADQRAKSSSIALSRSLSTASNHTKKNEEIIRSNSSNKTSVANIDDENIQTPERIDSVDQRAKSSSRTLSRNLSSTASNHTKKDEERIRPNSSSKTSAKNIDNENTPTPERIDSADQRAKSSLRTLSRSLSTASNHTKKNEEIIRLDSSNKSSAKNIDRENSTGRRSLSRQPSIALSEQSHSNQGRSSSLRPSSNNPEVGQSFNIYLGGQTATPHNDINKTPTNENEPNAFTVESEHFLHNQSQSPYDLNQRLPRNYSLSHHSDSRRSSTASSTLPVALDSPDIDDSQPPTSRTATPKKRNSISSIDFPPDPNVLLTTTDEADPDDPSVINSTLHLQMLSSQQPNADISFPERDEPSPLVNIVPLQEFSTEIPSVESSIEEHSREPSPTVHYSPSEKIELEPENDLPPISLENDVRVPSVSPSNHEQEEPIRQTPSPSKTQHQQESSRQSPLLSYPASLKDLMRPTPSPFLSTDKHEEQDQSSRLPSVSPPINETKEHHHHRIHQNLPPEFGHEDIRSPSSSPRHSEVSGSNHTSVEGEDIYRQQLITPPKSPQNERKTISPDHNNNIESITTTPTNNHDRYQTSKRSSPLPSPPSELILPSLNQRQPSSEKSASSIHPRHEQEHGDLLHRNDIQLSSASIKFSKHQYSPPSSSPVRSTSNEIELPSMTPSQLHSKLSLRLRPQEPKRKKSINDQPPLPQIDTEDVSPMNDDDNLAEEKPKQRQRRRVLFSNSVAHFQMEERQFLTNWRERVAAVLASKHRPNEKYAHIQSRVNSFANFEYQPRKIKLLHNKKSRSKGVTEQTTTEESKFIKRKKFKVKKPKTRPQAFVEEPSDDERQQQIQPVKEPAPQLFGRLWCLPDGSPTVFNEPLEWNVESRLKAYSYENFYHEPHRNDFKIFNKKPKWHSESKLADIIKESPRFLHRQFLAQSTNSLPLISDRDERYFYQQQSNEEPQTERKIFDIQTNVHQQSKQHFPDNMSFRSHGSRPSDIPIFNEKLVWSKKSKLKDSTWQNINYQPKKSNVQIFHKTVHWTSEPKIRTRSPSTLHPSRASTSNVQIFDEKLNWDAQAKVHCWSEIDLRQLTKKKAIFAQHHDPKWNDIVTSRVDTTNYQYPKLSNHVEIFSDRLMWTGSSKLKRYVWENFDYKSNSGMRQSIDRVNLQDIDQSPPNRPKWNAVSKNRSVNSVYNPKLTNSNMIRRGWDRDLRRKRVHKLPPLKRKREHEEIPQLAIDAPPSTVASTNRLAIDYNYDHSSTQEHTASNGYATTSSRRSSKALAPLDHHGRFSEFELPNETPRSQRPVQQEWYENMSKSRQTHRTDMGRTTNHSFRDSIDSIHQPNTPRELVTLRSSTRNSQNSVMSGTLLDSSIRSNRATELRLSKDMEEHHHHSHTPSQSMPIEIRGFKLEGTQLTVADHATIRPLSNVNYGSSERVKSRRVYPWSSLHPHGTSSRNSSLVPIAELRRPSLDTTITEAPPLIHEE